MLAIDEAVARIAEIQKGLSITTIYEVKNDVRVATPFPKSIKRAYPYFPKASVAITDTPCFMNQWTAPEMIFGSALMSGEFRVHMLLYCHDADTDRAAAIASAFYPKILQAFSLDIKLGGWAPVTVRGIRGADPTLATPDFAGQGFVGLDLYLDLYLNKSALNEP